MVDYNALAIFVASCGSTIAMILYAIQKSRCTTISCGCVECQRQMPMDCDNVEQKLNNVQTDRASISSAQQSCEPIGFSARPPAGASLAVRPNLPWCIRHRHGRTEIQEATRRPAHRDTMWHGVGWEHVWNICSSSFTFNTWKQLSWREINMSFTLQYLNNMPKRRNQNKQNRKLVQEQMNRQKEMKEFEKVKKPIQKADDVNSMCVICWKRIFWTS